MENITIYTDGSALGNPGPGGWGVLMINKTKKTITELGGNSKHATNNQMELTALLEVLIRLSDNKNNSEITIHLDSEYVKNGLTKWINNWKKNNWKTAAKKPVLNQDLWIALDKAYEKAKNFHNIKLAYVPGHSGFIGNEIVDKIARTLAKGESYNLFSGETSLYETINNIKL